MSVTRRVYVSMPADFSLDDRQNAVKWAVVRTIEELDYEAQIFGGPTGGRGLAAGKAWTLAEVDRVMRRCVGAAVIGFPKWRVDAGDRTLSLPTEFCHYEGAVAHSCGLPILAVTGSSGVGFGFSVDEQAATSRASPIGRTACRAILPSAAPPSLCSRRRGLDTGRLIAPPRWPPARRRAPSAWPRRGAGSRAWDPSLSTPARTPPAKRAA